MPDDAVVVIPAAGQGVRMAAGQNKLLLPLGSLTIIQHSLNIFLKHPRISGIYLVIAERDEGALRSILPSEKEITLIYGGTERQDSVFNALKRIQQRTLLPRWILVHDGARPLCPSALIGRILAQCEMTGSAIPVMPLTDTIREITAEHCKVVDRSRLFATQTPQGFEAKLLIDAYHAARTKKWQTTDDASIVEKFGHRVASIEGDESNFKITTHHDLRRAEWCLEQLK
ncbi:MAG: 2-C-methyl-D-erythritol 4-phosphate cytidylyltransferase [SAR324 cluster bacterium]|nr:2-C-methyl-D-erythritol 4-phosphate cytidylyltransferase [SAR324 cluster bacterium]